MAKRTVYTCNVCGKDKLKTNHWWIAYVSSAPGFMLSPWSDSLAENEEVKTLCGQECLIKAVNEWMQKQQKAATA